jgi:hypothetical protein
MAWQHYRALHKRSNRISSPSAIDFLTSDTFILPNLPPWSITTPP